MEKKRMIQIVRSVKWTLMAHPDNEENSEFADRISSLEELEQALSMSGVGCMFYCQRGDVTGSKRCEKQCEVCKPDY